MTFVRRRRADGADWIVKNPLSLDYYRLLEEEHFLLQQLDGRRSLEEIRRAFEVLVASGEAEALEDGHFQVTLGADITSKLEAGSNKIEIVVVPSVVSIPSFSSFEFVTTK